MPGKIHLSSSFQPDFGLPYPHNWREDLNKLSGDDLIALAGFKQALEIGHAPEITSLPEHLRFQATRIVTEKNAQENPVEYGWILPSWQRVLDNWKETRSHFICGGKRSSKSSLAAKIVVHCLEHIPECRIRCFQVNDAKSVMEQQPYIWEALPMKYKNLPSKRGATYSVSYTQANGFTGNKLILPPLPGYERGGECVFMTYQQFKNDPLVAESFWCHLAWLDEECDEALFKKMLDRVKDADGRILNTFTTTKGWTPLIELVLGKAKNLEKRYAPLMKKELPVFQSSRNVSSAKIYYFWTEDNPFLPDNKMDSFKGQSDQDILANAYGIPTKAALSVFTIFDEDIHVIKHEDIPFLKDDYKGTVTRYQSIDPAGDKPWFWIYAAIDAFNRIIVYDECPDESYGMWGEPGNTPEGKKGPAQARNNDTIDGYVEKMKFMEGENEIFERIIDARLANTAQQVRDASVTITSELEDAGLVVIPMASAYIQTGLDLIKNALAYDTSKPLGTQNMPRLRISDRCQNLIEAFKNYSNYNADEVWKDPMDCVRLLLISDPQHVSDKAMQSTGRTWSY